LNTARATRYPFVKRYRLIRPAALEIGHRMEHIRCGIVKLHYDLVFQVSDFAAVKMLEWA
jgi:hypothetical protein